MSLSSQGRDSASLSWNCPRNWLLVNILIGMKHVFVMTKAIYSFHYYLWNTYYVSDTLLEADSMVRNKAGKSLDFIYLLNTYLRAYYMPETVLGALQILSH